MLNGVVLFILIILSFVWFAFYKRDMLVKMFSLNITAPANELQEQLERTADGVIKRLEDQMAHLEYLLEEADAKSAKLDQQLQEAEQVNCRSVNTGEPTITIAQPLNKIVAYQENGKLSSQIRNVKTLETDTELPIVENQDIPAKEKDIVHGDKRNV